MTQTLAIFYDAYRSLNARKMFWIVLIISALVAAVFACVGINEQGLKIVAWQLDTKQFTSKVIEPAVFYKLMFLTFGISIWLSWIATILALVSTAGIFPDLISSGSIVLLASKPIGRLRLFLTQYVAGLLFVTLQVTLFTLASFLVIGLRGGAWEPGLFVAVPIVVCFFSYLFSVCVLIGLVTRSTLAALLLTLVFWFLVYLVGATENALLMFRTQKELGVSSPASMRVNAQAPGPVRGKRSEGRPRIAPSPKPPQAPAEVARQEPAQMPKGDGKVLKAMGRALVKAAAEPSPPDKPTGMAEKTSQMPHTPEQQPPAVTVDKPPPKPTDPARPPEKKKDSGTLELVHNIFYGIKTFLPKTTETIAMLERNLYSPGDVQPELFGQPPQQAKAARKVQEEIRGRSVWWVVGTSLGFELLVLACAGWVFCRRDY